MEEDIKYPAGMQMHFSQKDERQYLAENSPYPTPLRNPRELKSSPTNGILNFVKGKVKIAYTSIKNAFTWNNDSTASALESLSHNNILGTIFGKTKEKNLVLENKTVENTPQPNRTRVYDIGEAKKASFLNVLRYHKEILTTDIKTKMYNEKLTIIPRLTECQNYPKLIRPRNKFMCFEKLSQGYRALHFDEYGNQITLIKDADLRDPLDDALPAFTKSDSKYKLKKQVTFSNQKLPLERRTSKFIGYNPLADQEGENLKAKAQKKIKLANGKYIFANPELIMLNIKSKPKPKEAQLYKVPTKSSINKYSLAKSQENYAKHREYAKNEKLDRGYIHESSFASEYNVNDSKVETDEEDNHNYNQKSMSNKKSKRNKSYDFDDDYQDDYAQDSFPQDLQQSPIHKKVYAEDDDQEYDEDNAEIAEIDEDEETYDAQIKKDDEPVLKSSTEIQTKKEAESANEIKKAPVSNPFRLLTNKQDSPKTESPKQGEKKEENKAPVFGGLTTKSGLFTNPLKTNESEKPKENISSDKAKSSLFGDTQKAEETKESKPLFSFMNKKPEETIKEATEEKKTEGDTKEVKEPEQPKIFSALTKTSSEPKSDEKKVAEDVKKADSPEQQITKADSPITNAISPAVDKKDEPTQASAEKASEEKNAEVKEPVKSLFSVPRTLNLQNTSTAPTENPWEKKISGGGSDSLKSGSVDTAQGGNPFLKSSSTTVNTNAEISNPFLKSNLSGGSLNLPGLKPQNSSPFNNENKQPESTNSTSMEAKTSNLFAGILGANQQNQTPGGVPSFNSSLTGTGSPFGQSNNTGNNKPSGSLFNTGGSGTFQIGNTNNNTNTNENKPSIFGNLGAGNTSNPFNNSGTVTVPNFNNMSNQQPSSSLTFGLNNNNNNNNNSASNSFIPNNPFANNNSNSNNSNPFGGNMNNNSGSMSFLGTFGNSNSNQSGSNSGSYNLNATRGLTTQPKKNTKERAF